MTEQAIAKLVAEEKAGKFDRWAQVMKKSVREALEDFCRQDEEFAQAVIQGGTFEDCMKAVAQSCGNGLSDLEAYRRAVRFYFRGADIRFHMTIDLVGDAGREEQEEGHKAVILNLEDFW